jgi:hypothetical protein
MSYHLKIVRIDLKKKIFLLVFGNKHYKYLLATQSLEQI